MLITMILLILLMMRLKSVAALQPCYLLHFSYSCSIFNFVQNVPLPLRPSITMESRVPPNPLAGQPLTLWIGTRMGWLHR